jgi:predicted DNA-binding transcriptional regulator YafY
VADAKLVRLLRLLRLVPRAPRSLSTDAIKASLDAEGEKATMRTLQRDLLALEKIGQEIGLGIECIDRAKPYRWRRLEGGDDYFAPHVDPQAALALRLVETHLDHLLPKATRRVLTPYLQEARRALQGKPVEKWLDKVRMIPRTQKLEPPKVKGEVASVIYQALHDGKQIRARYKKRGATRPKDYVLHPAGLVYRDSVGILLARASDHPDVYQYPLHRFDDAELTSDDAVIPAAYSLDEEIQDGKLAFDVGPDIDLELVAEESAAVSLEETALAPAQTTQTRDDGRVVVKARVANTLVLRAWLLGFGSQVEVVKPFELREAIAADVRRAAAMYARRPASRSASR